MNLKSILKRKQKRFNQMTIAEKRMAIAKDVIVRIKNEQFIPLRGRFVEYENSNINQMLPDETQICDIVNSNKECTVCAKGGLFMSYVGYVDNFKIGQMSPLTYNQVSLDYDEMRILSRIFSRKQLSLIETAFEGRTYYHNERLLQKEICKCLEFYNEFSNSDERLVGICNNIIKNNGTFKP